MKKMITLLLMFVATATIASAWNPDGRKPQSAVEQEADEPQGKATKSNQKIYEIAEEQPEFPGGMAEMMKFMYTNLRYPAEAQKKKIQGRVVVQFVVEPNGEVSNVEVIRKVHPTLDKEAVRVVKSMPNFKPGKQDGKPVRVRYTLPVAYRLK